MTHEVTAYAYALLREHGLHDWAFRLDNARQRCGSCHFGRREITVSRHLIALNDQSELKATLLHEIAHALVGPGHGHGPAWQATARRIGARPAATNLSASMPQERWALRCRGCQRVVARRRRRALRLANVRCRHCGASRGVLEWLDTTQETNSPST